MARRRLGLRTRLGLAFVATTVLAVGGGAVVAVQLLDEQLDARAVESLEHARAAIARELDLRQLAALGQAEALAARDDVRHALLARDRDALLAIGRRVLREGDLDLATVTDAAGTVLARAHAPGQFGDDLSGVPSIARALNGHPVATLNRGPVVALAAVGAAPIYERAPPYRLLGVASAGFALETSLAARFKAALGHEVSFVLDGVRRFTTLPGGTGSTIHPPVGTAGPTRVTLGGDAFLVLYAPLAGRHGGVPVGTLEVAKPAGATAAAQHAVLVRLALLLTVVVLATMGLAGVLAARLGTPLRDLTRAAEALAAGMPDHRLDIPPGDEVGELAATFNRMAAAIHASEARMRVSEARFRDLYDNAPTAFISVGVDGRITRCNRAAAALVGHASTEDLIGRPVIDLYADTPEGKARARDGFARFLAGEEVRNDERQLRRLDGSVIWVSVSVNAVRDDGGAVVESRSVLIDITERRRAEKAARTLASVARGVAESLSTAEVARRVVDGATALWQPDLVGLRLARPDGSLEMVAPAGVDFPAGHVLVPGEGIAGRAARDRRLIFIEDITTDPSLLGSPELRTAYIEKGLRSVLAVPLQAGDRVLGTLAIGFTTRRDAIDPSWELLQAFADEAALALDHARLYDEATQSRHEAEAAAADLHLANARLEELSLRLLAVQETERREIARELHDQVGQELTAVKLALAMTARRVGHPAGAADLAGISRLVDDLIDRVRTLALDLRPAMLDDLGLGPALEWLAGRFAERTGIQVRLETRGLEDRLPPALETAGFRIVQEALTNVARHAKAAGATVRVGATPAGLTVEITDAGQGFDVEAAVAASSSTGLSGMRERAALLGGRLEITSAPGRGTHVIVRLPLRDGAARDGDAG